VQESALPLPDNSIEEGGSSAHKSRTLIGNSWSMIRGLAFSPDGRRLASAGWDKIAKLWSVAEGREARTFTSNLHFTSVAFSPDGRFLGMAAQSDDDKPLENAITLWDSTSPNEVRNLIGHQGRVCSIQFSPDGRLLASCDGAGTIYIWDINSSQLLRVFRGKWLHSKLGGGSEPNPVLAFSRDGRLLATRSMGIDVWDLSSGKIVNSLRLHYLTTFLTTFLGFAPDNRSLIETNGGGAIRIWDVTNGKEERRLADPPKRKGVIFSLSGGVLNSDATRLAVSTYCSADKPAEKVVLWDLAAGRILGTVPGPDIGGSFLAFSPDGHWLANEESPLRIDAPQNTTGDYKEKLKRELVDRIILWRTSEIR
jgi:WD40 repeat protein